MPTEAGTYHHPAEHRGCFNTRDDAAAWYRIRGYGYPYDLADSLTYHDATGYNPFAPMFDSPDPERVND